MSQLITEAFVQQFSGNWQMLAQQMSSRFRPAVMEEMVHGEFAYFDQIGHAPAVKKTTRHGDTPKVDVPHARRQVTLSDYEWADLIDRPDEIRLLIDPKSAYAKTGAESMNLAMDDEIIAAALGVAKTGKTGQTSVALPAGQKIPVAASGLTLAKLIAAREILDANEVPAADRFIACPAKDISVLLGTTQVQSADYNTIKALVAGEVDTFMGFKFIRTQRLPLASDGVSRACIAWQKEGLKLAVGENAKTKISERDDKSYSVQVFISMSIGATRMEESRVVEIATTP